jgi:hypothetical protein
MTGFMRRTSLVAIAAVVVFASVGFMAAPARAAATLVVDDDGKATAANCGALTTAPTSINTAIAAASPGDTVKVCPGTYNEDVVVDKTLRLIGAKVGVNGFSRVFNAASESIIATVSTTLDALDIYADNVVVDGFTMQNSNAGIGIPTEVSGYIVRNNIIRNNVAGVVMHSDGSSQSLVTRNKVLANNKGFDDPVPPSFTGFGILTFGGLSNAIVSGNFVGSQRDTGMLFVNCTGGVSSNLAITSNTVNNSPLAVHLGGNTTGVTISRNTIDDNIPSNDLNVDAPGAIVVGASNTNIVIGGASDALGNTINRAPSMGVSITDVPFCGGPSPILPAGGVSIAHNQITNSVEKGIEIATTVPARVDVSGNRLINNGVPRPDLSFGGSLGIHFAFDTSDNTISGNTVSGSGIVDCGDDSTGGPAGSPNFGTQNSWTLNTGGTDDPDGICPPP